MKKVHMLFVVVLVIFVAIGVGLGRTEAPSDEADVVKFDPALVQLSAVSKDLSPAVREQIRRAIIVGLRDSTVLVRQPTLEAVGEYGTAEMIPMFQEVARSDPHSRILDNGKRRFDVRDAAAKAIQSIEDRAKAR